MIEFYCNRLKRLVTNTQCIQHWPRAKNVLASKDGKIYNTSAECKVAHDRTEERKKMEVVNVAKD